jgi:pimeloyl-ACP methyl ester carboxylesterase
MTERCCHFGEHNGLAGVITEPDTTVARACILINAGLVPKAGPHRLYVELARQLAHDGTAVLRFDLGGIGDSQQGDANAHLRVRTQREIRAAVDEMFLRYPELGGVILGGICSGAEDAFRYAESDPRVIGVVLIDPFGYRTAGWAWRNFVFRVIRRALKAAGELETIVVPPKLVAYEYMAHAESSRILKALIERLVRVHFIYTGGRQNVFNHARQLERMFEGIDFTDRVTLDLFPWMDHTQVLASDRATIIGAIQAWLTRPYSRREHVARQRTLHTRRAADSLHE